MHARVDEWLKGVGGEEVILHPDTGSSCETYFAPGNIYLVFGLQYDDMIGTNACFRNRRKGEQRLIHGRTMEEDVDLIRRRKRWWNLRISSLTYYSIRRWFNERALARQ